MPKRACKSKKWDPICSDARRGLKNEQNIKYLATRVDRIVQVFHFITLWQYGLSSFQAGGMKLERFLPKNQHTQKPQWLAKIIVCKVDYFILSLFLVTQLRSVLQNEWKKHSYIFFSTFGSKVNKFEQKKLEKNKKIPKT